MTHISLGDSTRKALTAHQRIIARAEKARNHALRRLNRAAQARSLKSETSAKTETAYAKAVAAWVNSGRRLSQLHHIHIAPR